MVIDIANTTLATAITTVAVPTIDVSIFTSAPQAALMLQSLSILAAYTVDASLQNERTTGMAKLLKTPQSFRASLYQVSASMSDAFRAADQAMLRIKMNLDDIPQVMTSMINVYANPEDQTSKFIGNLRLKSFQEISKACSEEAKGTREKFDESIALVRELVQVTSATVGENHWKVKEAKKLLSAYEKEKEALEGQKLKLEAEIAEQKILIQQASVKYDQASEKMTSGWPMLCAIFVDTIKEAFGFFTFLKRGDSNPRPPMEYRDPVSIPKSSDSGISKVLSREKISRLIDGASRVTGNAANSAVASYQQAAEIARDIYIYQREMEQLLFKEDAANRMALAQIAAKMTNTSEEHQEQNLEEMVYYLSRGVKILGQIQQQWTRIHEFFSSLEGAIIGPMTKHLLQFDAMVNAVDLGKSGLLRNELAITGFKAAAICTSVARAANVYIEVSKKYVLPQIDSSAVIILNREDAKDKLPGMEANMEQVTKEVHAFVEQKLVEMRRTTVEQMTAIRNGFQKAMNGTLHAVPHLAN